MTFGHICQKKMPSPSEAVNPLISALAQEVVAAPASQARWNVFSLCADVTAGRRNRLSRNSGDACVSETK